MNKLILAVLQARYSSSRLPGKVMRPILGAPMLIRQIERLSGQKSFDKLIVATSADASDDKIAALCADNDIACFRGSLDDVLSRFYFAALPFNPDNVIRLTGDCPLADRSVIAALVKKHLKEGNDYTSNVAPPTFPDGLDCEIFKFSCLKEAYDKAKLPSEREHVTQFMRNNPNYKKGNLLREGQDLSHLRWTVDEAEDFAFVTRIYERLYTNNKNFTQEDILSLLKEDEKLLGINAHFIRDEGLLKSLEQDKIVN